MGCSTYLGLGWGYQPLAPGFPTSICDIGVNFFSKRPVKIDDESNTKRVKSGKGSSFV